MKKNAWKEFFYIKSYHFDVKNNKIVETQKHPFHLVDASPWPLVAGTAAFSLASGGVMCMHNYKFGESLIVIGLLSTLYVMGTWWGDVIREAALEGQHTSGVQIGLRMGMILFIVSEIMFFFAFFWAFFHSSLSPIPDIGSVWPPEGVPVLSAWEIPMLNTIILLSSGATITWAHHALVAGGKKEALVGLIFTVILAIMFTTLQVFEYFYAPFTISDSIYGSCFYMATGFHGFHVFIGTCLLGVCTIRIILGHYSKEHHFGLEAAAWYWHFVDVVWLFLFITIYWWGGK